MLQFKLLQVNKAGNVSFEAVKTVNVGKNGNIADISKEIASFTCDIIKLVKANKRIGFASAVSGIKKSLPMQIRISAMDEETENVALQFRNFGKFAEETTPHFVEKFLRNNIEFVQKHGYYNESTNTLTVEPVKEFQLN